MSILDSRVFKLLNDIEMSARRIIDRLDGETRETFTDLDSLDIQDIVARRLTIIGEAATALLKRYPDFCAAHPEIPLREARGMRNILVHDYGGIDWDTVWNTAKVALPQLVAAIAPLTLDPGSKNKKN